MHLIWENLIKNLVLLWTGRFKGLDEGCESYELGPGVWEAIGEATKASGSTIPSSYATARPQNVAEDASACTADSWSFWALYLGPVLLRGRFKKEIYYKHFVKLIKLLNICLQFEITKDEIVEVRVGFQEWVTTFERIYYQHSPDRVSPVSACPLTVHALLHIADGIEAMGPVWAYWAFPMERFCGHLLRCIKSRRHPFANIDSYVTAVAQLDQIKNRYNVHDQLALLPPKEGNSHEFAFDEYPTSVLCFPRQKHPDIPDSLYSIIVATLATRYNTTRAIVKDHFSAQQVEFWGKFRRLGGGDTMRAAAIVQSNAEDRRDASHVRYELYVDKYTNQPRRKPKLELKTFYGQIRQIILVRMPATPQLGLVDPETVILASIKNCPIERHNDLDMHYYRNEQGRTEVVDIAAIQCLVGRVFDRGWWVIIDRSGKLARAEAFAE
ncbi:hypothetical protein BDZ97DRAFT_1854368 [Flammula alnicola]|nr:hypothetical protein BDZ97DRAFT_1854368 [Flammula alnicola]